MLRTSILDRMGASLCKHLLDGPTLPGMANGSSGSVGDLITLGVASTIGLGQTLFVTWLLKSLDRGILKADLFVAGMTLVRFV